jgi:hypothetical protein
MSVKAVGGVGQSVQVQGAGKRRQAHHIQQGDHRTGPPYPRQGVDSHKNGADEQTAQGEEGQGLAGIEGSAAAAGDNGEKLNRGQEVRPAFPLQWLSHHPPVNGCCLIRACLLFPLRQPPTMRVVEIMFPSGLIWEVFC